MRSTFVLVLVGTAVALVIAMFLLPGQPREEPVDLPWQIQPVDGTTRVFGITLGETTLAQAEAQLGDEAVINLFVSPEGEYAAEAFLEDITLSGLRAKFVLTADLSEEVLEAMYRRGLRIATLGSGTRKVTLAPEDLERVRQSPVGIITYLPRSNLDEEVITRRFGKPAERVAEPDSGVVHLLYPEQGLDVAISEEEKEVLLYVPPRRFGEVVRPLGGEQ